MQMVERSWGSPCSVRRASRPNRISCGFDSKWCERSRRRPTRLSLPDSAVRGVRSALREHGIRDAAVEGSRLDLKSAYEYVDGGRTFVGYQCQAALAIESIGLDDVEALLIDVVAAGANELEAVGFDVRAKRELRARARREAVTAARAKAELYAEAAGIRALQTTDTVDDALVGGNTERILSRNWTDYPWPTTDLDSLLITDIARLAPKML
jgi:hypothetical protein